ncbi:dipeptide/oligopeptide/nickel ABC transporter permease/ATP-binding protein [Amycolatopsis mongoliensis]|uniref:Dipeptide/oligopeptide/nickel ABC transporter permease/ATP-binding protein n=1 Tax=Amycolatopsis mongoliensis TaxID=715475 RepID=A0A9Y2JMQ9_9PSEU|nr:dipeptide/oligopeptide/nickel ABC transporter permease/ATP-binding protein [Amycolatopsis sp. 4-36]WIY00878.1 dipeptide/oligopeptide/nickel ABC transporter permease/ATP-binding protein [Amycolatopsis sp. 4-36]
MTAGIEEFVARGTRPGRRWRTALRRPLALLPLGYLALLVAGSALAPVLAPYSPVATDLDQVLAGPGRAHWLGTDALGRDVLTRLMYGGQVSLLHAGIVVATVVGVGVTGGIVAGYLDGWFDRAFTWVVDVLLAIPVLMTLLVVLTVVGEHQTVVMVALGVLVSPGLARVVRGATLAVRKELYVSAARVCGLPHHRIVTAHVLPRIAGPIIVQVSLLAGGALLIDAGLSYLGFGAQPPDPTWGDMIAQAASVIDRQPWLLVPPGVVLGLAILAFGLLGDVVRDATAEHPEPLRDRLHRAHRAPAPALTPRKETSAALLSLRDVAVTLPGAHGDQVVVEDLDLDIGRGETVALVGESGCGKSITGRAILDLLPAGGAVTAGSLLFDGADLALAGARAMRRLRGSRIALISQDPVGALDPVFTVAHQVGELVRLRHGGSRAEVRERTLGLLDDVNLPEPELVGRRYPHELSGGMAQRVAIAMALAGEPSLLIADEPTTALDVTVQAEVLGLLRRLQAERGMAILLITHDWSVVAGFCRRAYVMYAGHIVESGVVGDLLARPRHPYTEGLLGAMPSRARRGGRLAAIPGTVPEPAHWPRGCHFAPRCALATAECAEAPIPVFEPATGHRTRCLHHIKLLPGGERDDRATA